MDDLKYKEKICVRKNKVWIVQKGNKIFKLMTKEINVYIEENNVNT